MIIGFIWSLKSCAIFSEEMNFLAGEPDKWPLLSIIIPACNEEEHIGEALGSLLKQDYPNFEIVAINDRSTDGTGEILDELAGTDPRLNVLHVKELPSGWLGKVNALHMGVGQAKGEWFLFTDADVHFHPGALRRTLAYAMYRKIDHLALFPKVLVNSLLLDISVRTFGLFFLLSTRSPLVNREGSRTPMGIGAFNLVSSEMFSLTPGFEWLRQEPCDDYGLGLMVNRAGGVTRFAVAEEDLSLAWYGDVKEMFKGLEKNLFGPGLGYQWWRMLFTVFFLPALAVAPPFALAAGIMTGSSLLLASASAAFGAHLALMLLFIPEKGRESLSLIFLPFGFVIFSLMMLWSAFRCLKNGGIDWRGTHYSTEELKKGQRVKF
ncbi:MAG: glycosyltransferase [bacterium]|nr:glycosyltransferase [bacterium]